MSAITAALAQLDDVAAEGDLAALPLPANAGSGGRRTMVRRGVPLSRIPLRRRLVPRTLRRRLVEQVLQHLRIDPSYEPDVLRELALPPPRRLGPTDVVVLHAGRNARAAIDSLPRKVEVVVGLAVGELPDRQHPLSGKPPRGPPWPPALGQCNCVPGSGISRMQSR
jgi:hypothetical protein